MHQLYHSCFHGFDILGDFFLGKPCLFLDYFIVIANEKIDKVYYNYGNNTEGKIVNIDIDNSRNSTSVLPQNQINAGNVTRIINNIRYMLNHIGYASDEEEEDSN